MINNSSSLPIDITSLTLDRFYLFEINSEEVSDIIKLLNVYKAHGHDGISIRMLKMCITSISKPLTLIYKSCLSQETFPEVWKKANIIPIHKKSDKSIISSYRPISLLPICGKILERIIHNNLFKFLNDRDLLCPNQSGFRPNDSCINQLLSITHLIHKSFDANPTLEVRGLFLDMSKAFDKVWHEGLLYKLRQYGVSGKAYELIKSFLSNRFQRVTLNGQHSDWTRVNAGVPQGSILGPLFFLIYINDLSTGINSEVKLFADDTSIFSVVKNVDESANTLNDDLHLISQWAFQWKMSFNPDPNKQAHEVVFSTKKSEVNHPDVNFNGIPVAKVNSQKHLGLILDKSLSFNEHLEEKFKKVNKGIGVLKRLAEHLPRSSLLTIYKSFLRPLLDYGDTVYDHPNNKSFIDKIESIQYNAARAITGAIRGTSKEKLYQELGLEYLQSRRWCRKMCLFFNIIKKKSPNYLHNIIPTQQRFYRTRTADNLPQFSFRTDIFRNSFFPFCINEWNILDTNIRGSDSYPKFKNSLLKFIKPKANSVFFIRDSNGLKLLTRLRLGLSQLREHKFNHNFLDTLNPLCSCSLEVESTTHFFLRCHHFTQIRVTLMNKLNQIDANITELSEQDLTHLLLYGDVKKFSNDLNTLILSSSIAFITSSKRFDEPFM